MHNQQLTEASGFTYIKRLYMERTNRIKEKACLRINIMHKFKFLLDRKSLETSYISFIRSIHEYGDVVWHNCTQQEKQDIEKSKLKQPE